MRRLIFLFVFALVTSTAAFAVAADKSVDKSAGHAAYKADLSAKSEVSGMKTPDTMATGEAVFEFTGPGIRGMGTGGAGESGVAGTAETTKDSYYGGILKDEKTKSGGSAGGGGTGGGPTPGPPDSSADFYYRGVIDRPSQAKSGSAAGGATGDVLRYKLNVKDIENVTAAHLHMGKESTAEGPVIAPLFTGPKKTGEFSGMLSEGIITAKDLKGPLSGKSIADLAKLMNEGNVYVNVHTAQNPGGEIRGEVLPR